MPDTCAHGFARRGARPTAYRILVQDLTDDYVRTGEVLGLTYDLGTKNLVRLVT